MLQSQSEKFSNFRKRFLFLIIFADLCCVFCIAAPTTPSPCAEGEWHCSSGECIPRQTRLSFPPVHILYCTQRWHFAIYGPSLFVVCGLKTSASPQIHTFFLLTNIAYHALNQKYKIKILFYIKRRHLGLF